jgi:cell division control protein 24
VEQTNALPEEEQNWGKLFVLYNEAFKVYEPYIANQRRCEKVVVAEFNKLKEAGGSNEMRQMVESPTSLYGFLMKPFQRLSKYPLLLGDLHKKGDLDEQRKADLIVGKEAATSVLSRTNHAVDREEKAAAVQELKMRVEDWKGHRVEGFGELLMYGTFTVLKSENLASGKDAERQVCEHSSITRAERTANHICSITSTFSRRSCSVARISTSANRRTSSPRNRSSISVASRNFSSRVASSCRM